MNPKRLQSRRPAAAVEAIFVDNASMRDQMLPRKPFPHPELEEQSREPLRSAMPSAEIKEKQAVSPKRETIKPMFQCGTPVKTIDYYCFG